MTPGDFKTPLQALLIGLWLLACLLLAMMGVVVHA